MNRDKSPGRMDKVKLDKSKIGPSPLTYQIEKMDMNRILSTKEKTLTF